MRPDGQSQDESLRVLCSGGLPGEGPAWGVRWLGVTGLGWKGSFMRVQASLASQCTSEEAEAGDILSPPGLDGGSGPRCRMDRP